MYKTVSSIIQNTDISTKIWQKFGQSYWPGNNPNLLMYIMPIMSFGAQIPL